MTSSSSSSSSLLSGSEYDVFLSFRGEDTRKGFVGHLYRALDQRGIRTFKDDKRLEQGKSIFPDLVKNINESCIAVIVFSKNYANSSWCLDELVEILECMRTKGQIVLPIFYDVKASQVRKQKKSYAVAFKQHEEIHKEEMERVQKWRAALKEAANLSGFDLEDADGDEDNFIQRIVQVISRKLKLKPFRVAEFEVGIESRAKEVIMLLNEGPKDKLFVGISGIGGIGKTTVAKEVFNQIFKNFEGSCFLENVREESTKDGGLAKLQSDLLRETLMDDKIRISSPDRGINEIKNRLRNKRLLLVLDDVDKENTLKYLVGGHEWFGNGTRIILTIRDKRLLENYNVKTYNLQLLNDSEALQLFSWYAFKKEQPEDDYDELARRAKDYAKGLPLALKVFGSHLYKRRKLEWSSILDRLETNPSKEIQDVLRISYDGLDNKEEKDIFLDIACFFKGYDKEDVKNIYQRHEFDIVIGIQILSERCLIDISKQNKLSMHDLMQKMGREIVRQESEDPGKRSRLWSYEDIYEVFTQNTVTEKIEAIMLPKNGLSLEGVDSFEEGLHVRADAFTKMRKLRILKIDGVQLDGCLTYLSNELRYLDWNEYPEEDLPYNFRPKKLVQLHLHNSPIKGIWTNTKFSVKLKILDLSFCNYLKETPNFSMLPYLEELDLQGCTNLVEVHPSIEFHERLIRLNFVNCKNLKRLATRINLKSLECLYLHGCSKFEKFPEIQGDMERLEYLGLDGTAMKELPPSVFKHLNGLVRLDLIKCKMLKNLPCNIGEMKSLEDFWLEGTAVQDLPLSFKHLEGRLTNFKKFKSLPSCWGEQKCLSKLVLTGSGIKKLPPSVAQLTSLGSLEWSNCDLDEESILNLPHSLWQLILGGNNFVSFPASFTLLTKLTHLELDGCLSLQTLDSLPSSIHHFTATYCISLERYWIPTIEVGEYMYINLAECHKLVENDGKNKPNIYYNSESELLQEKGAIIIPGSEIPSWFSHIYEIESNSGEHVTSVCLRIDAPTNSLHYLTGVYACVVIGIDHEIPSSHDHGKLKYYSWNLNIKIRGCHEDRWNLFFHLAYTTRSDHIVLFRSRRRKCISNGCDIKAVIPGHLRCNGRSFRVKKFGIHLVMATRDEYDDDDEDEDENECDDEDEDEDDNECDDEDEYEDEDEDEDDNECDDDDEDEDEDEYEDEAENE